MARAATADFHIVLAAYRPNLAFFSLQIRSIQDQTLDNWTCEIRDDGSPPDLLRQMKELVAKDRRFWVVANERNLNVYHNFEAGLAASPKTARYIALCDQDDVWAPEKLETLKAALEVPGVVMAHSDLEAIDADGKLLLPSVFQAERRQVRDHSLPQLLLLNVVTGCTMAFHRSLLEHILPFPAQGSRVTWHHDLWIALVAAQAGEVQAIDKPLVQYRQHGGNVVGVNVDYRLRFEGRLADQVRDWAGHFAMRRAIAEELLARKSPNPARDSVSGRKQIANWFSGSAVSLSLWRKALELGRAKEPALALAVKTALGKTAEPALPLLARLSFGGSGASYGSAAPESALSMLAAQHLKQMQDRYRFAILPAVGAPLVVRLAVAARTLAWIGNRVLGRRTAPPRELGYNVLKMSGLFDVEWYLRNSPDLQGLSVDPVLHYLRHGADEGRSANGAFDPQYYLTTYPDVAASNVLPLVHFARSGGAEGRNPSQNFDTKSYLSAFPSLQINKVNALAHALLRQKLKDSEGGAAPQSALSATPAGVGGSVAMGPDQISAKYLAPIPFALSATEPRVVFVLPSALVQHAFGGVKTILELACQTAMAGVKVRVVSFEQPLEKEDEENLRRFFVEHCGLTQSRQSFVDVSDTRGSGAAAHVGDLFVATIWWSATRLARTLEEGAFRNKQHYYLVQDFEPGFYAWSDEYALALSTYRHDLWRPIVNTSYLAGALEAATPMRVDSKLILAPAIDLQRFHPPSREALANRTSKRRVFFYARPGTPRNLFALAVAALRKFVSDERQDGSTLEVVSAGEPHAPIMLGRGITVESLGKLTIDAYAEEARHCDIGLSLMLSPHPSYPPLELAASGVITISNTFQGKTLDLSDNIIACAPSIDDIARGLGQALARAGDADSRVRGASVNLATLGHPVKSVAATLAHEVRPRLAEAQAAFKSAWSRRARNNLGYAVLRPLRITRKRVCLFSHFDIGGRIDPHVLYTLSALKEEGFDTVLVSSCASIQEESVAAAAKHCAGIIARENLGLDFAGWAAASMLAAEILEAEELLCTNDSNYGPVRPFREVFDEMATKDCDFWALTESLEVERHLQSFFVVFRRSALESNQFRAFWDDVLPLASKDLIIRTYEVPLARRLTQSGLKGRAMIPYAKVATEVTNPTMIHWRRLIERLGFPYVKVQLLRDNPIGVDLAGWRDALSATGYPVQLIIEHLRRVQPGAPALAALNADLPRALEVLSNPLPSPRG